MADRATVNGWELIDPRFGARTAEAVFEPNKFGWIVEIDPFDPALTPLGHTALGWLKHEGANIVVGRQG